VDTSSQLSVQLRTGTNLALPYLYILGYSTLNTGRNERISRER